MKTPDFFIIGAAKSGTTTLYNLLQQHPDVYLPFDKEPMFFSRDSIYARGWDWYLQTYFAKAPQSSICGEASPHYLYWSDKVAPRMATHISGHARFIVIFRDPVERAYSWYWNAVREGLESRSFADALAAEEMDLQTHWDDLLAKGSMQFGYFRGGCYATLLQPFLNLFPKESFLFLFQEDLRNNFGEVIAQLAAFLNLSPWDFQPVVGNPASLPRHRAMQHFLTPPQWLTDWLRNFPQILPFFYRVKENILTYNLQPMKYPPMDDDIRIFLRKKYRDEILVLQDLTGRDLSQWL